MEPLTNQEIEQALTELSGWVHDDDKLWKKFEFKDFREALGFIVRVGLEAETAGHHPNLFNVYNQVSIGLQTHDAGNKVTTKDVELARAIESIT
ncbi:MAG: 4a-hydroxytetrahydrobiopterin dehydratase [Balneola sp.]